MSEDTVKRLANSLNIPVQQAAALWLKTRQAMFETLQDGMSVDLGFCYMSPGLKKSQRRHDFQSGLSVTVPQTRTLRIKIPPHVRDVLEGRAVLSEYIWMTRSQIKGLEKSVRATLDNRDLTYYRLKGASV